MKTINILLPRLWLDDHLSEFQAKVPARIVAYWRQQIYNDVGQLVAEKYDLNARIGESLSGLGVPLIKAAVLSPVQKTELANDISGYVDQLLKREGYLSDPPLSLIEKTIQIDATTGPIPIGELIYETSHLYFDTSRFAHFLFFCQDPQATLPQRSYGWLDLTMHDGELFRVLDASYWDFGDITMAAAAFWDAATA